MATKKIVKKAQKASVKKPLKKAPAKKSSAAPKKSAPKKAATKPAAKSSPKKVVKKVAAKSLKPAAKKSVVKAKKIAAPVKKKTAIAPKKKIAAKPAAKKSVVKKIAKKVVAPAPKKVVAPAPKKVVAPTPKKEIAQKPEVVVKKVTIAPAKPVAQPLPKATVTPKPTPIEKSVAPAPIPVEAPVKSISPKKPMSNVQSNEKMRFSDAELKEFKELLVHKLEDARAELINLQAQIINANENGTDDTGASFKMLEDGSDTLAKEEAAQLAARQKKFIEQLESAMVRIENKTYGLCRVTGKLIAKERLRAVPHTTQSMEAKLKQNRD